MRIQYREMGGRLVLVGFCATILVFIAILNRLNSPNPRDDAAPNDRAIVPDDDRTALRSRSSREAPIDGGIGLLSEDDLGVPRMENEEARELKRLQLVEAYEQGIREASARHSALPKSAETPQLEAMKFDVLSFPQFDGSTSTQPLVGLIACKALRVPYTWVSRDRWRPTWMRRDALSRDRPEAKLAEFFVMAHGGGIRENRLARIVNHLLTNNASTHDAYVNLIEGRSELGLLVREPSSDERDLAAKKNVELVVDPIALDALVFIVHRRSLVSAVTTNEIIGLYSNPRIVTKGLHPLHRERNSGSHELMKKLIMKNRELKELQHGFEVDTDSAYTSFMAGVYLKITEYEPGLAYSVWYYERYMIGSGNTKTLSVDGVHPTYETIRDRRYPYVTPVMLVTRKSLPEDSEAASLRAWLLSSEGQRVIKESGYVPISEAAK